MENENQLLIEIIISILQERPLNPADVKKAFSSQDIELLIGDLLDALSAEKQLAPSDIKLLLLLWRAYLDDGENVEPEEEPSQKPSKEEEGLTIRDTPLNQLFDFGSQNAEEIQIFRSEEKENQEYVLPTRVFNALLRSGMRETDPQGRVYIQLSELIKFTPQQLRSINNIGPKAVMEIISLLEKIEENTESEDFYNQLSMGV